jgi:hypothetical protein
VGGDAIMSGDLSLVSLSAAVALDTTAAPVDRFRPPLVKWGCDSAGCSSSEAEFRTCRDTNIIGTVSSKIGPSWKPVASVDDSLRSDVDPRWLRACAPDAKPAAANAATAPPPGGEPDGGRLSTDSVSPPVDMRLPPIMGGMGLLILPRAPVDRTKNAAASAVTATPATTMPVMAAAWLEAVVVPPPAGGCVGVPGSADSTGTLGSSLCGGCDAPSSASAACGADGTAGGPGGKVGCSRNRSSVAVGTVGITGGAGAGAGAGADGTVGPGYCHDGLVVAEDEGEVGTRGWLGDEIGLGRVLGDGEQSGG